MSTTVLAGNAPVERARQSAVFRRYGPVGLGTLGVVLSLLVWEAFAVWGPVNRHHLPGPTTVLPVFFKNFAYAEFWMAIGATLRAWAIGLAIATAAGIAVGVVIGSSRILRQWTHSLVEFLRPIPAVGLIPVGALLFGPRLPAELLIVIYACFWIIMVQVVYGVADIDKVGQETVRTFRMSTLQRLKFLVFPTLLPYLVTGFRLAATVALIVAVTVELLVGTPGLGHQVAQSQLNDAPPQMYALILTTGVLGIIINLIMRFIERKILFWHSSVRAEVQS